MIRFPTAPKAIVSSAGDFIEPSDHSNNSCIFIDISIKISHSNTKGAWNSMKFLWWGVCKCTTSRERKKHGRGLALNDAYFKMNKITSTIVEWREEEKKKLQSFDIFCFLVLFMSFQFRQITIWNALADYNIFFGRVDCNAIMR